MQKEGLVLGLLGVGIVASGVLGACSDDELPTDDAGVGGAATTTTGSMVTTGMTTGMMMSPFIGRTCTDDTECGENGRCLTPDGNGAFAGGAAGGYCTKDCGSD